MEGFIFYASFFEAIRELPNDSQLRLYQAITNFALNQIEPENLQSFEKAVFAVIKPQLIANQKRYENGKKGGRPKKETIDNSKEKSKEEKEKTNGYEKEKPMVMKTENLKRNIKIKKEKENKIENKKEIEIKKEIAVVKANRTLSIPQQALEFFIARYKQLCGKDYLPDKKDFILIAELCKKFGLEEVKQRTDWLATGCKNSVFWFAKNVNDFTVGTLRTHWNRILPQLTEEQKRELAKKKKEEELETKVKEELARQGIFLEEKKEEKGGVNVIN